jgi:cob(I)alamin adenosyltransferase
MAKHRGDSGTTSLYGGVRVDKDDGRIDVCGNIDELSASLGVVRAEGLPAAFESILLRVQQELISFCAEVVSDSAMPDSTVPDSTMPNTIQIVPEHIRRLESDIATIESELPPLTQFIIPGDDTPNGRRSSAMLHLSRTICRRAERSLTTLCRTRNTSPHLAAYLNRLGGLLFAMARKAASHCTEVPASVCRIGLDNR